MYKTLATAVVSFAATNIDDIALFGVAVLNGVVMVSYINKLFAAGTYDGLSGESQIYSDGAGDVCGR